MNSKALSADVTLTAADVGARPSTWTPAVNLLNPTLATTTINGVTCTNNGDCTYTLNGTSTGVGTARLREEFAIESGTYKLVGCPKGGGVATYGIKYDNQMPGIDENMDIGDGRTFTLAEAKTITPAIRFGAGVTFDHLVFKPMITTDMSATYNDFVPYAYYTQPEGVFVFPNAGSHNSFYRGKYLGAAVTAAQYAAIKAGSFEDLYIGDYWTIGGVNYRVAAFDYYLNCGDTNTTAHHVVIVPDTALYNAQMNTTNTTNGGYMGSAMYTANLEQAKTTINAAFSGHVLSHRIYLTTAVANGIASGVAWANSTVDLMNEQMVYGCGIFSPVSDGTNVPANFRVEKAQLALFRLDPSLIANRATWWLRDVITATRFAFIGGTGNAYCDNASASYGVRPSFCIYGG